MLQAGSLCLRALYVSTDPAVLGDYIINNYCEQSFQRNNLYLQVTNNASLFGIGHS